MAWAQPEYATAQIAVWWDMKVCPIPEGYDAPRIRPNMEAAFRKLGYSGPVSITAYGDQEASNRSFRLSGEYIKRRKSCRLRQKICEL